MELGADEPETDAYDSQETDKQMIVAEDVVYGFRQKTEMFFHEIGGQSAGEIEQTVWDYIDSKAQENALDVQIEDVVVTSSGSGTVPCKETGSTGKNKTDFH